MFMNCVFCSFFFLLTLSTIHVHSGTCDVHDYIFWNFEQFLCFSGNETKKKQFTVSLAVNFAYEHERRRLNVEYIEHVNYLNTDTDADAELSRWKFFHYCFLSHFFGYKRNKYYGIKMSGKTTSMNPSIKKLFFLLSVSCHINAINSNP